MGERERERETIGIICTVKIINDKTTNIYEYLVGSSVQLNDSR